MGKVVNLEFRGLHRTFEQLRSADRRSIVAAYRFGQIIDALHRTGYSWEELGDEVDRSKYTMKLYAALYNKYDNEQALLGTADAMKTYDVSRLAGKSALVPVQYVFHCTNCGSYEVKKERKQEDDLPAIVTPKFQSAG